MNGWDMREGEVYKKNGVYKKKRARHKYQDIEKKREEDLEKREWTVTFLM